MKTFSLLVFLGLVGVMADDAAAIVGAELLAGQRSTKFSANDENETINATEVQASIHVDPIPMVPVALGLYYIMHDYKPKDDGKVMSVDEFTGSQIGAQVYVWVPLKPTDFSIFAKAGYTFLGNYEAGNDNAPTGTLDQTAEVDLKIKSTGTRLAVGMKWSPIAIVSGLLQFDYAMDKMEIDEIKINGVKDNDLVDDQDKIDATSYTILAGFQVGF